MFLGLQWSGGSPDPHLLRMTFLLSEGMIPRHISPNTDTPAGPLLSSLSLLRNFVGKTRFLTFVSSLYLASHHAGRVVFSRRLLKCGFYRTPN